MKEEKLMVTDIRVYSRPNESIRREIREIAELLTHGWFTDNVPSDLEKDLMFQDVVCMYINNRIASFIMFTCLDGTININIMGTHPAYRRQGLGTIIMDYFFNHVRELGFNSIKLFTVPPDAKPAYSDTVSFYEKNGFKIKKRYKELWECGAIEMEKELSYS